MMWSGVREKLISLISRCFCGYVCPRGSSRIVSVNTSVYVGLTAGRLFPRKVIFSNVCSLVSLVNVDLEFV